MAVIPAPGSANKMATITPNSSVDNVPAGTRGIIISTPGTIHVTFADGTVDTLTVPAMVIPLVGAKRIWADSTASGFIAMYDVEVP